MKKNVKITGVLVSLVMLIGAGTFVANNSNAQEKTYIISDRGPAGGWIFYDKGKTSDGWRYLEAAPVDQSKNAGWGCVGKSIPGAQGTAVGTGKSNTLAIVKGCGETGIAAKLCTEYRGGGKSDWFLPSKDELDLMYTNLHKAGVGAFNGVTAFDHYWSSSEDGADDAWSRRFAGGRQNTFNKSFKALYVRAVRAF